MNVGDVVQVKYDCCGGKEGGPGAVGIISAIASGGDYINTHRKCKYCGKINPKGRTWKLNDYKTYSIPEQWLEVIQRFEKERTVKEGIAYAMMAFGLLMLGYTLGWSVTDSRWEKDCSYGGVHVAGEWVYECKIKRQAK